MSATAECLAGGSPVIDLQIGRAYLLTDRTGVFTLLQFHSSDEVVVRENGRGTLWTVPVHLLQSLTPSENTRTRDLSVIEDSRIHAADRLLEDITPLLQYKRIPKDVLAKRAQETGRAAKTLRLWTKRYQKDPRLSSLQRKQRSDVGEHRFHPAVEKVLEAAVASLLANPGLRLQDVQTEVETEVHALRTSLKLPDLKAPSYGTLYNRFNELSERQKAEARLGKRPAKLLHGISQGSLTDVNYPLALVQVDHLELPVVVVDEVDRIDIGKAWITVLIDVFSRCLAGYYITLESPGNLSLGLALAHAVLPKTPTLGVLPYRAQWPVHGLMSALHADNAGEFHGNMLERAAGEYGIDLMYRKVKNPNYGGHIESYLGTLSDQLKQLPGATREGPAALGDTDPRETAAMTLDELERYVLNLVIEYHNRPHSGIGNMAPIAKFMAGMRGEDGATPIGRLRRPTDEKKFRLDFLPCDERCVHPKGIVWDHIWYVDDTLQRWVNSIDPKNRDEKRKFLVRRDPRDLSRLYFWDPDIQTYRIIGTRNLARPSISLWELNGLVAYLKRKGRPVDEDAIFAAREDRHRITEEAKSKTRRAQSQRARSAERQRRAAAGAQAHRELVAPAPAGLKPDAPSSDSTAPSSSPGKPSAVGTAYELDWGD